MKNYDNIRVYGDLDSEFYLAPLGSTLPTAIATDPTDPFWAFGWLSEDGVDLEVSTDAQKFKAFQGGTTVRTKVTSTEKTLKVQALEETPGVTGVYFDHGDPVVTGVGDAAVAKIILPEAIRTRAFAGVAKFVDNDVQKWLVCERLEVTSRGTVAHKNSDMTIYEFTFDILGDAYILTNAPAYLEA